MIIVAFDIYTVSVLLIDTKENKVVAELSKNDVKELMEMLEEVLPYFEFREELGRRKLVEEVK